MNEYLVEWSINLTANTPKEAVNQAVDILRDPDSVATLFFVLPDGEDDHIEVDVEQIARHVSDDVLKDLHALMLVRDAEAEGEASTEDLLDAITMLERYVYK